MRATLQRGSRLSPQSPSIGDHEDFTKLALGRSPLRRRSRVHPQLVDQRPLSGRGGHGLPLPPGHFLDELHGAARAGRRASSETQTAIVVSKDAKMATYKSEAVIHSPANADWDGVKGWFYAALSGGEREPDNLFAGGLKPSSTGCSR